MTRPPTNNLTPYSQFPRSEAEDLRDQYNRKINELKELGDRMQMQNYPANTAEKEIQEKEDALSLKRSQSSSVFKQKQIVHKKASGAQGRATSKNEKRKGQTSHQDGMNYS